MIKRPKGRPQTVAKPTLKKPLKLPSEIIDEEGDVTIRREDVSYAYRIGLQCMRIERLSNDLESAEAIHVWSNAIRTLENLVFPLWGEIAIKNGQIAYKPTKESKFAAEYFTIRESIKNITLPKKEIAEDERYKLYSYELASLQEAEELKLIIYRESIRLKALYALLDKNNLGFDRMRRDYWGYGSNR